MITLLFLRVKSNIIIKVGAEQIWMLINIMNLKIL